MFLETPRFPTSIALGSQGGPGFNTDVVVVASGAERRNQNWQTARARYDVRHGVKTRAQMRELIAFFRAMKGRLHSFRFKDHADYNVTGSEGVLVAVSGASPAVQYQLYKQYDAGSLYDLRKITKPVSGTVTLTGTGTYSLDYTTGVVTVSAGSPPTSWTGEFDVPVRFDTDMMKIDNIDPSLGTWDGIELVEVLDE
jgi:uncharacterized protein (TIGR02217 family)